MEIKVVYEAAQLNVAGFSLLRATAAKNAQ
jgi:hypothetical protein